MEKLVRLLGKLRSWKDLDLRTLQVGQASNRLEIELPNELVPILGLCILDLEAETERLLREEVHVDEAFAAGVKWAGSMLRAQGHAVGEVVESCGERLERFACAWHGAPSKKVRWERELAKGLEDVERPEAEREAPAPGPGGD